MIKLRLNMQSILSKNSGSRLMRRVSAVGIVIAVGIFGSFAYASVGHKAATTFKNEKSQSPPSAHFSVLTHPPHWAQRIVGVSSDRRSPHAILASTLDGSELYVSEEISTASGEQLVCLTVQEANGATSHVCALRSDAEQHGLVVKDASRTATGLRTRVDMLMPDGTSDISVTGNHERRTIALHNNVAQTEIGHVESVTYTLPDGAVRTVLIPSGAEE